MNRLLIAVVGTVGACAIAVPAANARSSSPSVNAPDAARTSSTVQVTADDRGTHTEPGDDHGRHGRHVEPGDDHGHGNSRSVIVVTSRFDDRGRHVEPGDDHGHHGSGHGSDD